MSHSETIVSQYSRANPSLRYKQLVALYRWMHEKGEPRLGLSPEKTFWGKSLLAQARHIKRIIDAVDGVETLLDYGSGKGLQYKLSPVTIREEGEEQQWPDFKTYWGVKELRCYDPAYPPFSDLPTGRFDGVICTDVLEHCPEEDIPWIVEELFSYAKKFVYASVACYPADKHLPTGENAHCTVKPFEWWKTLLRQLAVRYPHLRWHFRFRELHPNAMHLRERIFSNVRT